MNLDDTARQYFLILDKTLPAEILKSFTEASASEVIFYHYTIGMWVRNHFLSPDDDLYKAFLAIEIYDKDSMSYFFTYMYHLHRQVFSKSAGGYNPFYNILFVQNPVFPHATHTLPDESSSLLFVH